MLAPAFTSALLALTLASTPTFGFTLTVDPEVLEGCVLEGCVVERWSVDADWFIVEDELTSVDCCPAATLLETDWSPSPTFTPGLMFAPALMSVLLMPTLASMPTLGFALTVGSRLTWAWAPPYAANTAAAARLKVKCLRFMLPPFSLGKTGCCLERPAGRKRGNGPCGPFAKGWEALAMRAC